MKALALDMTICNTGYSVWELQRAGKRRDWKWLPIDCGCISSTDPNKRDYQMVQDIKRCQELLRQLEKLVEAQSIKAVVVELLEGTQNARAAKTFGLVIGMLAALVEKHTLPVYVYRAQDVKRTLTGSKAASKEAIIEAVLELYPMFCPDHGFQKHKVRNKLQWPSKLEHMADSMALIAHAEDQHDFRLVTQMAIDAAEFEEVNERMPAIDWLE